MITSDINGILIKNQIDTQNNTSLENQNSFIDSLIQAKDQNNLTNTDQFTYENIKQMSTEQIDLIFTNEEDNKMAKNLKIATMFTEDKYLGKALFNTVLGQPFELASNYLFDTYNDKHSYLSSLNSNNSLGDILNNYISYKIEAIKDGNTQQTIPQEYLDEILLEANSIDFLSSLSNSSKDQYGRYKDEDDDYSFLYSNYELKYQELLYKYDSLKSYEKNLINQY